MSRYRTLSIAVLSIVAVAELAIGIFTDDINKIILGGIFLIHADLEGIKK